jgi:trk system potassium uptake protein TrkH
MGIKTLAHFSPGRIIFYSIFLTIIVGTAALALPFATVQPISLFDLFFTATSATCVTGLFTVPLDQFTHFGHTIILILMQIGGLGLITLTIFLMSLFVNFGFATQLMAVKLLDLESWKNIRSLIIFIITLTVIVELVGALLVLPVLLPQYTFSHACFLALFHSVTSFCNAGISIFDQGTLAGFSTNSPMLVVTIFLMFAGSFGFLTWHELMQYARAKWHHKRYPLSLNTKIIIYSTAILIIASTIILFLLERHHAFNGMSTPYALLNSLFQAVSARNAGFLTVNIHTMQIASLFFILLAAFIGSSPASTGSGVKITTFAIFISTIKAAIAGRTSVEIRGRSIAIDQVYKATAIVSLGIFWVGFTTFLLLISNPQFNFFDLLLEAMSAFATLGISMGITSSLTLTGKIILIINMIIGRIGSLTLVLAFKELRSTKTEGVEFSYPEERVVLN